MSKSSSSSSCSEEDGEEEAARPAMDAADTHPLLPEAEGNSNRNGGVMWCDTCDEVVREETAGITEGRSTCPKCRHDLREIETSTSQVRTELNLLNNLSCFQLSLIWLLEEKNVLPKKTI